MATKAADQPQHAVNEYQDCILCRLTGTVVMSMLSLGAFKEAWRLHREAGTGNRMSSASAQAQTAEVMKGAAATVSRLVKAMAVFPPSAGSDTPAAASRRAPLSPAPAPSSPGGSTAAAPSLKRPVGHPTGRVAFLALAGVGFAGAAIWRAVMPANKPIQPVATREANGDKQQQSFAA
ncbi:hypothetical protein BDZ90DRAFT_258882 [Jaminaea rosea]|uniref:DUF4536 domain-containing protein n=1 Tax=Jaminaea rosea TaxID=1569628 RepID=A0A316UU17_9BASI|nr:hypothetical protein BDZ90DRAFT_258882 [Jaminaea rosea]PWN28806.1 hypothetical protein BDZ90DRAFT_258882 [Jaminaea rosea]